MYVCLCHAVTESAIRDAVENGASSLRDLSRLTGCGTQCGSCVRLARETLSDTLAGAGQEMVPAELEIVSAG